jgi:hypothetical protein
MEARIGELKHKVAKKMSKTGDNNAQTTGCRITEVDTLE